MLEFNIEKLRGSIFMPQIAFNWKFIFDMMELLPDYLPSVISGGPQMVKDMVLSPGEWTLTSPDGKIIVVFKMQKVDYIEINTDTTYNQETIETFARKCQIIFGKILELTGLKANRLAIAPTFKYLGEVDQFKTFINTVYAKNSFKKSYVDNCDFSQVFRVDEEINGTFVKMNYLSKFSTANAIIVANGINTIQEVNILDFDINTQVNPNYTFDRVAVGDFFNKVTAFCSEFLSWYSKA